MIGVSLGTIFAVYLDTKNMVLFFSLVLFLLSLYLLFLKEKLASAEFDHLKIRDFSFEHLQEFDSLLITTLELKAFHHLEKVSDTWLREKSIKSDLNTLTFPSGLRS